MAIPPFLRLNFKRMKYYINEISLINRLHQLKGMDHRRAMVVLLLTLCCSLLPIRPAAAGLRQNYYADACPDVENIVRAAVAAKYNETFVTIPGTLRLIVHDCLVEGCDASILITSTERNKAERDHPDNLSLAGDGFDTIVRAKAAVDAVPQCRYKVSCADILVMAARDVVALAGGPSYSVELGRLDALRSTAANVDGKLPQSSFELDQLNSLFAANGLSQEDMIALSGAHTLGFSHCRFFANRIRNFNRTGSADPTMNQTYAAELRASCPPDVDPNFVVGIDPTTPLAFDNNYYVNLRLGKGLLTSDQTLFTDQRSRPTVDAWAENPDRFRHSFVTAMTRLGRVGVKTEPGSGDIRRDCTVFN